MHANFRVTDKYYDNENSGFTFLISMHVVV